MCLEDNYKQIIEAKKHADLVSQKERVANDVASSLNKFFAKYKKDSGTYELRLAELRDDINKAYGDIRHLINDINEIL